MEFYEAINKRRTTREFLDKEVDFETIKRTVFKCKELKSSYVSNLNPFATIWWSWKIYSWRRHQKACNVP